MLTRNLLFIAIVGAGSSLLIEADAKACSVAPLETFVVGSSSSTASVDIPLLRISAYEIERGCGSSGGPGDCSDLGRLGLTLESDRAIDPSIYGAILRVESGETGGLRFDEPFYVYDGNRISNIWGDGKGQPEVDFNLTARAVDHFGNLGVESEPFRITHGGGGNCCTCSSSTRPGGFASSATLVMGAAVSLFALRRRARPSEGRWAR